MLIYENRLHFHQDSASILASDIMSSWEWSMKTHHLPIVLQQNGQAWSKSYLELWGRSERKKWNQNFVSSFFSPAIEPVRIDFCIVIWPLKNGHYWNTFQDAHMNWIRSHARFRAISVYSLQTEYLGTNMECVPKLYN